MWSTWRRKSVYEAVDVHVVVDTDEVVDVHEVVDVCELLDVSMTFRRPSTFRRPPTFMRLWILTTLSRLTGPMRPSEIPEIVGAHNVLRPSRSLLSTNDAQPATVVGGADADVLGHLAISRVRRASATARVLRRGRRAGGGRMTAPRQGGPDHADANLAWTGSTTARARRAHGAHVDGLDGGTGSTVSTVHMPNAEGALDHPDDRGRPAVE